jgi:hypothetical protein
MCTTSVKDNGRDRAPLLCYAMGYASRGWSIIPVKGKHPATRWKPFQQERASAGVLRKLFANEGVTGIAVVTGKVSGGLAVRDFDKADAYLAWAAEYPNDASVLPTVQTARGFHVYGRLNEETFADLGDGEIRADTGHYVILPPSRHPDGSVYAWLNSLPESEVLPHFPPSLTWRSQGRDPENANEPNDPNNSHVSFHVSHGAGDAGIEQAIANTLPSGPRQRRKRLFDLARILKSIIPAANPAVLRAIVREWHGLALPVIRTKEFSPSWTDFIGA